MNISRNMLNKAVQAQIITEEQAKNLITFLNNLPEKSPSFNLTNVLYYFGGLISIGAMTIFMSLGWESFGGWWIFTVSILYAMLGIGLSDRFSKKNLKIPAGICATFVIALTPLAIYGLQRGMGWWPDDASYQDFHRYIQWQWIFMELGTLIVGVIMAWFYRYPFMMMPIAVTLWYMSMDLTKMLSDGGYNYELSAMVSMYFGIVTVLIAFWVDIRSRDSGDYAFWLYLFGVLIFWGGLSSQSSDSEISRFMYLCINLLMIFIGVILNRRIFVILGALGSCFYLGHLSFQVFQYSYLFVVALTVIGLGIIYLGVLWQKHETVMTEKLRFVLPKTLKELLEARD